MTTPKTTTTAKVPAAKRSRASAGKAKASAAPAVSLKGPGETEFKKSELIDLVVEKSMIKKKYAKPVVEAMLEVLGEKFGAEEEMNLQPMGKVRYNRVNEKENARVVIMKLRQSKGPAGKLQGGAKEAAADTAE